MKSFIPKLKKIFFTPLGVRMSKDEIMQSRGVALLMVMISMILVTAIVVDLGYDETVRYRLAINTRDSIKAEALAEGGLNWARLFLVVQSKIQDSVAQLAKAGMQMPAYTVWQILPLDSDKLKILVTGQVESLFFGRDLTEVQKERAEKAAEKGKSSYKGAEGGFGDFDGSFNLEIVDEESKISLAEFGSTTNLETKNIIRKMFASLISPQRYDDIFTSENAFDQKVDRPSVIANVYDWLDADDLKTDPYEESNAWGRVGSGTEKDVYRNDNGIVPKNAYFDSMGEMRLVHGVTDEFEQAFFDSLTIYGQGGKINILSAKDQVVEALMRFCALNNSDPLFANLSFADEMLKKWKDYPNSGGSMSVDGFMTFLEANELKVNKAVCQKVLDVKSQNFTVTSKASVNNVTRTLTLVTRVVNNAEEIYYFRSR